MQTRDRGRQWRTRRAVVLSGHPLCADCDAAGRLTAATEVDHIVPLFKGGNDGYDNLRPLCHDCHTIKSRADMGHRTRVEFEPSGLPSADHPWAGGEKSSVFNWIPRWSPKNSANRKNEGIE